MKIAVAGKGGVGKTTVAGTIATVLDARPLRHVIDDLLGLINRRKGIVRLLLYGSCDAVNLIQVEDVVIFQQRNFARGFVVVCVLFRFSI